MLRTRASHISKNHIEYNTVQKRVYDGCKLTHSIYSHCVYVLLCLYLDFQIFFGYIRCVQVVILAKYTYAYSRIHIIYTLHIYANLYTFNSTHMWRDWYTLIRFESQIKQVNKRCKIEVIDLFIWHGARTLNDFFLYWSQFHECYT